MFDWFQTLGLATQAYAVIAIPAALFFLLQTILLLFGMTSNAPIAATETDSTLWRAVYALLAFFTLGGWSGMAFLEMQLPLLLSVLLSLAVGVGAFLLAVYVQVLLDALQQTDTDTKEETKK